MEKSTIPLGLTAAQGHSGLLGQSTTSWPTVVAFGQPTSPAHGQSTLGARSYNARDMAWCLTVRWWLIGGEVFT
jgi:hypothetical protein